MATPDHLDGKTIISILRSEIDELRQRISVIDEHGTHYLPVATEKALELAQRVTALETNERQDVMRLEGLIEAQAASQVTTARWRLTFITSFLVLITAVVTLFISMISHSLLLKLTPALHQHRHGKDESCCC